MHAILIIDDHPDAADVVALAAQLMHCSSVIAHSAAGAIEHLKRTRFDAVVLDYYMPDMGGAQLLRVLRTDGILTPLPPILVYSGDPSVREKALLAGATAFVEKAGDLTPLARALEQFAGCGPYPIRPRPSLHHFIHRH